MRTSIPLRLVVGAVAGLAGTIAMSAAMAGFKKVGWLGEPPPRMLTRRIGRRLGIVQPRRSRLNAVSVLAHLGFGAAAGAGLAILPRHHRTLDALYGFTVWLSSYAGWIPKLGLMRPPTLDRPGRPTSMIASHFVFGLCTGALTDALLQIRERKELSGKVVVICGGSRGLGRAIARELTTRHCKIAICARTADDLEEAKSELARYGATTASLLAEVCDLRDAEQANAFLAHVQEQFGRIDVVIANAATLTVGPIETMGADDFNEAIDSIFKTSLHAALAAVVRFREHGGGTLVFITSIGGKIGVPHLAPYSAAKFAERGLAESLRAELVKDNIHVLTVVPGLMRTGSHLRASFKGDPEKEFAWFGTSAMAPGLSIDADRAAKKIVRAIESGKTEVSYTLPARLVGRTHDLFPELWSSIAAWAAKFLPRAPWATPQPAEAGVEGRAVAERSNSPLIAAIRDRSNAVASRQGQI